MSVSATQPRRPADDFLASLQSNLQGNARTRRRRGQQQAGNTNAVQKSNVAPKVQSRARPPPVQKTRQNRVKPEPVVGERNKGPKRSTNPPRAAKSDSPKQKQSPNEPNTVPPSNNNVQVYSSQPPQPEAPIQHPIQYSAPPVEVVQPVPTYQYPVAAPPEHPVQQQQNVRASQNNFYMKNQSNIFNTGYVDPFEAKRTQQQAMRSTVADRVVVDNALRIASQQPLPPTPSFSAQRVYNVRPEESNQQSFVPNQTVMVMQQNGLIATQPGNVGVVPNVHPHLVIAAQNQPYLNQQVVGPQQVMEPTPVVNEAKPINSHYHQSFSITGGEPQDNRSAQEVARQKWVQELEAQVREKKQREQQDKMLRHKSPYPAPIPTGVRSTVPNYQPAPAYNNPAAMNLQQVPPNIPQQPNNYPPNIPQQPPNIPVYTQQSPNVTMQPPQVQHLASRSPARQISESPTQGRMLGQGAWVDPEELERRTDARKRARENQEMIRQQVEERERLKKEEKDKIKREEELQMKRIEEEKRLMAEEVRLEQEKRRQKEAAQLQQIQEMRQKIEEANKKAKEEKRNKRSRSAFGNDQDENVNTRSTVPEEEPPIQEIQMRNERNNSVAATNKSNKPQTNKAQGPKSGRALVHTPDPLPIQETVEQPVQQPVQQPVEQPAPAQQHVFVQQPAPVQQSVRYVSNAATQTVHEVSCQTMSRENSVLPAESKLIQLQERELSSVQRQRTMNNNNKNNRTTHNKPKPGSRIPGSKLPVKQQQTKKVPEKPKILYGKNGRRIKPKPVEPPPSPPREDTPPPLKIIAEESEAITNYSSIADIFDDPQSPVMVVESVGHSPYTVPDQQKQMRYTSPKNEERSIPSAISVRQNDILSQLEKLRMGLKDRRRTMSSAEIIH